jgi:hypothetical protein
LVRAQLVLLHQVNHDRRIETPRAAGHDRWRRSRRRRQGGRR